MLVLFDLNGFKTYNDTFGHPAGDALLTRLAAKLAAAVAPAGSAYRMGGDEFCVLLPTSEPDLHRVAQALCESGEGFTVTSAYGAAVIPDDATTVSAALSVADERLYAHKELLAEIRRGTAHEPLLRTLAEREPELRAHVADVSSLAVRVGEQLGLAPDELEELRLAAELHDVGKLAIPDAVLQKAGAARSDRMGLHPLAHADRAADPQRGPGAAAGRRDRPLDARELGRHRLSRRPRRRGDPARGADHRRLRRVLRDHERPAVPRRAHAGGGGRRAPALRRPAVRPAGRGAALRGARRRGRAARRRSRPAPAAL